MFVYPKQFVWCGVLLQKGMSESFLRSNAFVQKLTEKMLELLKNKEFRGYTVDVVMEGVHQTARSLVDDGIYLRSLHCELRRLRQESVFLKPSCDSVGELFIQIVIGQLEFLISASREVSSDDGWPEKLADDIDTHIGILSPENCILGFIRPQARTPFLMSAKTLAKVPKLALG